MYIVVEGVEGAGKSSALKPIKKIIENLFKNKEIIFTREPGGTQMAEEIRNIFKKNREEKVSTRTEMLLMYAAREQLISNVIKPSLENNGIVISDRSFYTALAYQGTSLKEKNDITNLDLLHDLSKEVIKPDLVLFLNLDSKTSRNRVESRGEKIDRIEERNNDFFDKSNSEYINIFSNRSKYGYNNTIDGNAIIIDASQSLEIVTQEIETKFSDWLFNFCYGEKTKCQLK